MGEGQVKSRRRVVDHGEVFTAEREVNAMLDMVRQETERIDSRFLEPACGNGNFLAEVLRRKLAVATRRCRRDAAVWERDAFGAGASLYGVELLEDNVAECRDRLLGIVTQEWERVCGRFGSPEFLDAIAFVLSRNIQCGDALTMKTAQGEPITFSEWSLVFGDKVKRRDYRLCDLLENQEETPSLFPSTGTAWGVEEGTNVRLAPVVAEFAPTSIFGVVDHG